MGIMSDCPYCAEAMERPTRGGMFSAQCLGCSARSLAASPMAMRAMAGEPRELQAAIERVWRGDYSAGRAAVWEWIERIKRWKAQKR